MRRSSGGLFGINMALSISHNPCTGITCALLLGYSDAQVAFILYRLRALASLASHPLLLPALISANIRTLLGTYADRIVAKLLKIEMKSGQTGIISYDKYGLLPSVGTLPQELCSRWGTRAELSELIPWRRIGAA